MLPHFDVQPLTDELVPRLRAAVDGKTKPLGALGALEDVAVRCGSIQATLTPRLQRPALLVFAADHGATEAGISAYPREVTAQMVHNFLVGGAAINVFARRHGWALSVVDAGVASDFDRAELCASGAGALLDRKIGRGTRNYVNEPAMTAAQRDAALAAGAALVEDLHARRTNVVGFGEMGIGNSACAALLMSFLCERPVAQCVGRGAGLDEPGLCAKLAVLERAHTRVAAAVCGTVPGCVPQPFELLRECGGFEIAMMCAAMLRAAERRMIVLVDGFIATSALLVASAHCPAVLDYCIASHRSSERGHRALLEHLALSPLLDLGLRLGEGTGAALALPLVHSAVDFLNDMASFESARVSGAVTGDGAVA
ncbi:MAG: nicotinate-nucleotide--dimethylbenzimidazole phosphoribosyltransferase [Gammaproteobacteria bacterium]